MFLYRVVSSAYWRILDVTTSGRSIIKIVKNKGPSTDPCGTPEVTSINDDEAPSCTTR
jgi:hypothetical protein